MPEANGKLQADAHVEEVVRSAERELYDLLQRRADLMKRIGTLKQTLSGLADLFGDSVLSAAACHARSQATAAYSGTDPGMSQRADGIRQATRHPRSRPGTA